MHTMMKPATVALTAGCDKRARTLWPRGIFNLMANFEDYYLNRLDESAGFWVTEELLVRRSKLPVRCFLLVLRDRNSSDWLPILGRWTEAEVNRVHGQVHMHGIVRPDGHIESGFHDYDAVRINGDTVVHDFAPHLLANALFIQRGVLVIAGDALNVLLKLIILSVWRQQLEREINEAHDYNNTEN
jgi:hypothetical protein